MYTAKQDLRYLSLALPELKEYLLSGELFWPLTGDVQRLTLGGLLFALARLGAVQLEQAQMFRRQMEAVKEEWRVTWEKKAAREVQNRLRLWSEFLRDYRNASEQNADWYASEVRWRVILNLLLKELPNPGGNPTLEGLDELLKASFLPGDFAWDASLRSAFPADEFWFLYGELKA